MTLFEQVSGHVLIEQCIDQEDIVMSTAMSSPNTSVGKSSKLLIISDLESHNGEPPRGTYKPQAILGNGTWNFIWIAMTKELFLRFQ